VEASALQAPLSVGRIPFNATLLRLRSDDQLLALFRANKRFDGYVASSAGSQEHVVREGWGIDLVFIDRVRSNTRYTVVYKHLDFPRAKTYRRRTKGRNVPSVIHLQAGTAARIDVRWYVQGKSKARWTFTIRPRETSGGPAA